MTIFHELSRENLWGKNPIKQMGCVIVILLICVNSAYEKNNHLGEEPTDPHVVYNRYIFSFLNNAYGHQDEMGGEVSTKRYVLKDC